MLQSKNFDRLHIIELQWDWFKSKASTSRKQKKVNARDITPDIGAKGGHDTEMDEGETRYWKTKSKSDDQAHANLTAKIKQDIIQGWLTAFMTGNVTARHKHITRTKNHYERYIKFCEERGIKEKAQAPDGWGLNDTQKQSSIADFTVRFMVDCNLAFRVIERLSFQRLIMYLRPKSTPSDIPHWTMIADNVARKTETLDQIKEDPVPAVLTAVCTLSREDYWFLSDAGWTGPTNITKSFADVKPSFTCEAPTNAPSIGSG
ncbi:uncharacterized protein ARMOST_22264 [Armillaria ostoyae]|uniref:Uncharacterized protein n=1 Tax=Armillaria ostoyae TaxID=47428 RepID=A0A284SCE0_ARMOS|nr:uncharacterized protein ARMOST_22264 [Armillaria ostoyae]